MEEESKGISPPIGEAVEFEPISEPWCSYRLPNGDIFEIRLILTRLEPEVGYRPEKPLYRCEFQGVPRVKVKSNHKTLAS